MRAEPEGGRGEPVGESPQLDPTRRLAAALRAAASRAADLAGGGISLIFVSGRPGSAEDDGPHLRAAAGFAVPDAAREAARALRPRVRQALGEETPGRLPPVAALGERAAGERVVHPLRFEGRGHGALVVGGPEPLDPGRRGEIENLAATLALRLDHARLAEELAAAREQGQPGAGDGGDQSEEILRLSEALFAQDIELLRKNEKLGKVEKLKNDFIEKMSRELRTPLNSIIESIISVLTGENEALSDAAKASLRTALDDGTSFLRTLQNILDLWRIKQGELPVEIQDVNFREVVDEAIFSIQDSLGDKPLRVERNLAEPFPKIRTDLAKVNQILFLLLDNAAKFTPRGQITISAHVSDETLVCEVRDTGIGICPDDQQFVFDEFFQVDEPSAQTYSGAGLGLTLVRDLLVLLDGEVSILSEAGGGTAVTFRVPVQTV